MGTAHLDIDVTADTPACDETQTRKYNQAYVVDLNAPEHFDIVVSYYVGRDSATFQCDGGPITTCTSDVMVHYANGTEQFERTEYSCTQGSS